MYLFINREIVFKNNSFTSFFVLKKMSLQTIFCIYTFMTVLSLAYHSLDESHLYSQTICKM